MLLCAGLSVEKKLEAAWLPYSLRRRGCPGLDVAILSLYPSLRRDAGSRSQEPKNGVRKQVSGKSQRQVYRGQSPRVRPGQKYLCRGKRDTEAPFLPLNRPALQPFWLSRSFIPLVRRSCVDLGRSCFSPLIIIEMGGNEKVSKKWTTGKK